ncbi:hypothetical protein KO02_22665 [Sphingobacterium sp. ML3W]|uniref:hypothetical protein n=1 Tax=Sphingobacterium sp. ML3W TaxID=1538644 RepID=UPI0004F93415|nr:hypothetical protein [Sphingobacterium sp. ML3W]AIM39171.1 hypothetical protein KO02_22665 [Sphingobacterium sp. ML3W]
MIGIFKKLNSSLIFILSKYMIYGLQFLNAFFIAFKLGPYYLGVWGFANLVFQYFDQLNLGISHSVNVICSTTKEKKKYISLVVGNSMFLLFLLSIVAIITYSILVIEYDLGSKYQISKYLLVSIIVFSTAYFNSLLTNVVRVYGAINQITIAQAIFPITTSVLLFLFKEERLLDLLLMCYAIVNLFILFFLYLSLPIRISFNLSLRLQKSVLRLALPLFFYNTFFYLIFISTRTFVSSYYSVEDFGYFTFTFSLANIIVLLSESFSFLIWPKLINRFKQFSIDASKQLLVKIRTIYLIFSHLCFYIALLLYPLLSVYFGQFNDTYQSFSLSLVVVTLLSNSFGLQGFLIAKGAQNFLALTSLFSLILNIALGFILIYYYQVTYYNVLIATSIAYLTFNFVLAIKVCKFLFLPEDRLLNVLRIGFDISILVPFFIAVIIIIMDLHFLMILIPLFAFFVLNIKKMLFSIRNIKMLFQNPDIFNI